MRKTGKILAGTLMLGMSVWGLMGTTELAQAACGTFWEMGEKSVSFCGGVTEDGTFTAKLEGNEKDGYVSTVILNNYKGEAFYPRTYGSGHYVRRFIVELNGVNEVTLPKTGDEGSEQVYTGGVTYELAGEGRLSVKAADVDGSAGSGAGLAGSGAGSDTEKLPDDALIGPTEEQATGKKSVGEVVLWVAVRMLIAGGLVALGAGLAVAVMRKKQRSSGGMRGGIQKATGGGAGSGRKVAKKS